nr:ribonuclease H-like domain-containing protein [Tanacetum cinerariifolium]
MKCPEDIKTYAKIRSDQKLFQFLNGLDRKFKPITQEILRVDPLPTAGAAYATVRKEAAHQNILGATNNELQGIATGLIAEETEGIGFVTKGILPERRQEEMEILRVDPLPTAEAAYATVRKEAAHQNILGATNNELHGIATGLIAEETEGIGFVTKGYCRNDGKKKWVIKTRWIIGRGTEREGLYYVDKMSTSGTVMLAHGTSEREAWLWQRRPGHPS